MPNDDIELVSGTTADFLTSAFTDQGETRVVLREVDLIVRLPDGTVRNRSLLVAHDTESHRVWWHLGNSGRPSPVNSLEWFASRSAIFVSDTGIAVFQAVPLRVFVTE